MAIPDPGTTLQGHLSDDDQRALREAADWFWRLQAGDATPAQQRQWQAWLACAQVNARAWNWLQFVNSRLAGASGPVVSSVLMQSHAGRRRAFSKVLALALGAGAVGGVAMGTLPLRAWTATHHAGVGQGRRITLGDGSLLWLDTDSAADVAFDDQMHRITLVRGRMFIQTAPGVSRALRRFEVLSPQGTMRPVGTRFAVQLRGDQTALAVFEGAVDAAADDLAAVRVAAGWAVDMHRNGVSAPRPASRAMQAWTDGVLMADHVRLGDFLTELARYRHGWIHCDPAVADLMLFGSYPLRDIDGSLDAIARTLPVRIERRWPGRVAVLPQA